jgi:hypothetical protein
VDENPNFVCYDGPPYAVGVFVQRVDEIKILSLQWMKISYFVWGVDKI